MIAVAADMWDIHEWLCWCGHNDLVDFEEWLRMGSPSGGDKHEPSVIKEIERLFRRINDRADNPQSDF